MQAREDLRGVCDSGAKHISFRGNVRELKGQCLAVKLPRIGDYVLFNEQIKCHTTPGSPCSARRGIGRVVSYVGINIYIDIYVTPSYVINESFRVIDFSLGLFRYVRLFDKLYVGRSCGYSFQDLDVDNPHKDILALLVNDEENQKIMKVN